MMSGECRPINLLVCEWTKEIGVDFGRSISLKSLQCSMKVSRTRIIWLELMYTTLQIANEILRYNLWWNLDFRFELYAVHTICYQCRRLIDFGIQPSTIVLNERTIALITALSSIVNGKSTMPESARLTKLTTRSVALMTGLHNVWSFSSITEASFHWRCSFSCIIFWLSSSPNPTHCSARSIWDYQESVEVRKFWKSHISMKCFHHVPLSTLPSKGNL